MQPRIWIIIKVSTGSNWCPQALRFVAGPGFSVIIRFLTSRVLCVAPILKCPAGWPKGTRLDFFPLPWTVLSPETLC